MTLIAATGIELTNGDSVPVPAAPAVPAAASIMVTIAAPSTPMTICWYENRETAAHYGQEQRENDQTSML